MDNIIKYLAFYDLDGIENRNLTPAGLNKMDYIISVIEKKYDVQIISPAWTHNKKFYKGKTIKCSTSKTIQTCPTLPYIPVLKYFSILLSQLWLFIYLILYTKKDEVLLVYHTIGLMYPLYFSKRIKGFKLCLQVEEIYHKVTKYPSFINKMEYKIIRLADSYIFPTELLNKKFNPENKAQTIIYGTYQVEEDQGEKFDDEKIHVVYAGTFDPRKGGALAAAAAEFLPDNYHVHIIGFGSNEDKSMLLRKIDEISKATKATITYDGLLRGEEYIQFIQKCQIGLSTQNPDVEFNDTSFPSKILSYMANGLRVVSARIKAIEISAIGNDVYYYDEQNPKDIAEAILSIDFTKSYDSRKIIEKLDNEFAKEINALLKA